VLKNITDYLIEEASAEEEELLGHTADQEEGQLGDDTATVERDEALIKVDLIFKVIIKKTKLYGFSLQAN
jgi:hypothetical protein